MSGPVDLTRLVYVWSPQTRKVGTGFRVSQDAILTASHVADGSDAAAIEVRLFRTPRWVAVQTVEQFKDLDVALLHVAPDVLPIAKTPAPGWGEVGAGSVPFAVQAVGFPKATRRIAVDSDGNQVHIYDSAYIEGRVYPAQEALAFDSGQASLQVTSIEFRRPAPTRAGGKAEPAESPWSGYPA